MDISEKKISVLVPTQPSSIPKPFSSEFYQKPSKKMNSEETDENGLHFSSEESQNSKRAAKNFMSPTISTASKVTAARKNILVERNEASESIPSDTHMEKRQKNHIGYGHRDLGSDFFKGSCIIPQSSVISESGDNPDSLSSLPYDPLTNYLSPRPQFLRYKPNRRLEMVLHRECELRKGGERSGIDGHGSIISRTSIDMPFQASIFSHDESEKQDGSDLCSGKLDMKAKNNIEIKESDDDDDGGGGGGGDDDDDGDLDEAEAVQRTGCCNWVLKSLLLLVVLTSTSSYISSTDRHAIPHSLQALPGFSRENMTMQDPVSEITEISEKGLESFSEVIEEPLQISSNFVGDVIFPPHPQLGERGLSAAHTLDSSTEEINGDLLFVDDLAQRLDLDGKESNETAGLVKPEGMPVEMYNFLFVDDVNLDVKESNETAEEEVNKEDGFSSNFVEQEEPIGVAEETGIADEWTIKEEEEKRAEDGMVKDGDTTKTEFKFESASVRDLESDIPHIFRAELNLGKREFSWSQSMQDKFVSKHAVGVVSLLALVTSMILGYLCLKHRTVSAKDSSYGFPQPSMERSSSCFLEKEHIIEKETTHSSFLNKEQIMNGDSNGIPSLAYSFNYYDKLYSTRPPVIELLGEYRMGEFSHSERSCVQKSNKTGKEETDFSQSQEKKKASRSKKRLSFTNDACTSSAESPSYGSFTTMEKLKRKEVNMEGYDGEAVVTSLPTPVRRSSRIRNRVLSP